MTAEKKFNIRKLTYLAILTSIVIVLQFAGSFIRLSPTFSISLVLVPIVLGVALCDTLSGAWLGFIFGCMVFASGDATLFLQINPFGTIITVLLKGILCGLLAGITYKMVSKFNKYVGIIVAAIVCPLVNTGIFLLGCRLFFFETISSWAAGEGVGAIAYMFLFLVGGNFLFELLFNIVLSPAILKLVNIAEKGYDNIKRK